jgi:hypothetical protein
MGAEMLDFYATRCVRGSLVHLKDFIGLRIACTNLLAMGMPFWTCFSAPAQELIYFEPHTGYREVVDAKAPGRFAKSVEPPHAVVTGTRKGAALTFNVTYADVTANNNIGFDDPSDGAARRATSTAVLSYIIDVLNSGTTASVDIEFMTSQTDESEALASAGTYFSPATQYSNGMAFEHITTGNDPDGLHSDIEVTVDFGYTWYSGTEAPANNQYDLFTVLLHEITHGLGFSSLSDPDGISEISLGNPGAFSNLDDNLTRITQDRDLWNSFSRFEGSTADLKSNNVGFSGTNVEAANGNAIPKIYAPNPFQNGSSLGHWDTPTFPDEIMNHAIAAGVQKRTYGALGIAALKDFGYSNATAVPISEVYADFDHTGTERGTSSFPVNTFAEAVAMVESGGTIYLDGSASDLESGYTDTISTAMTIDLSPGTSPVRIGVSGGGSKVGRVSGAGRIVPGPQPGSGDGFDSRSISEAALLFPGLNVLQLEAMDLDGDGRLSDSELVASGLSTAENSAPENGLTPKGDTRGGCFAKEGLVKTFSNLKDFVGDLFLLGLVLTILAGSRGFKSRP